VVLSAEASNPRHVFECAKSWREVLQMSNVTRLRHALPMSQDINAVVSALDKAIAEAVDAAKAAGLPQGLIVAELHGHAQVQTNIMVS
jgi:hypothetical protein